MKPEVDPDFLKLVNGVETLEALAVEHETRQCGPHKEMCLENRAFIVAMVMHRLNLDVTEIGFVAAHLFDMEMEDGLADDAPPVDDVLDSEEIQ